MKIKYKKKKINIPVKKVSELGKIRGLMFRKKTINNLLFAFNKDSSKKIHSFFVFFDFLAIWTDSNGKVLEWKIVKPFSPSVKSKKPFRNLIEVPMKRKNEKIARFFVGKGKI